MSKQNKKCVRRIITVVFLLASLLTACVVGTLSNMRVANAYELNKANVDIIKSNIETKALYANVGRCYAGLKSQVPRDDIVALNNNQDFLTNTFFKDEALKNDYLHQPFSTATLSCKNLFKNWGTNKYTKKVQGINKSASLPDPAAGDDLKAMETFLKSVGYNLKKSSSGKEDSVEKCFYFQVQTDSVFSEKYGTAKIVYDTQDFCVKLEDNKVTGVTVLGGTTGFGGSDSDLGHLKDGDSIAILNFPNAVGNKLKKTTSNINLTVNNVALVSGTQGGSSPTLMTGSSVPELSQGTAPKYAGLTYDDVVNGVRDQLNAMKITITEGSFLNKTKREIPLFGSISGPKSSGESVSSSAKNEIYVKQGYNKFIDHFLSPEAVSAGTAFTSAEKYILYYTYLTDYYSTEISTNETSGGIVLKKWPKADFSGFDENVHLIRAQANASSKRAVLDGQHWNTIKMEGWEQIAKRLGAFDVDNIFKGDLENPIGGATTDEEEGEEGVSSVCNNVTGLAWILCPVAQLASDAVQGMYDWIESHFLEINASVFARDKDGNGTSVFGGWQQFQGFANIIFVILLVLVILSQITGFGISNYGIKKALPKLIVVVILVNLSFLFCQIAVDLSNILGYALRNMFQQMADDLSKDGAYHLPNVVKDMIGMLMVAVPAAILVTRTQFWKQWVVPFLLALLGVIIGVLFFLITLGVRQAAVLILVVISPVAIVCYALPNTKRLFDRWWRLFYTMLMVFPVCGALMGGGQLAATVIAGSGEIVDSAIIAVLGSIPGVHFAAAAGSDFAGSMIMDMIAMLVQVAPFFMVPSVVRSSLNAIGNIGNKLNQMGSRLGNRASNSLSKTEAMQDFQRRMEMSRDKGLLNRMDKQVKGSNGIKIGNHTFFKREGKDLSARQNRRYAQLTRRRLGMLEEDKRAELGVGKSYMEGSEEYNTLMNRIKNEQMEKDIKAQRYNIGESEISDDVKALRDALDGYVEELSLDPDNSDNKAKIYAHLDQLTAQGDTGMTQVGQAILAAVANNDLEGAQVMSRYILKNYAKQYKDKQRGTFDMAGDLSRLNLDNETAVNRFKTKAGINSQAKTREVLKADGTTDTENYAFYTSEYDKKGIDSLDAQRIGDINEDTLTRYYELAMSGQLDAQQMASLSRISARALANDANGTGHVQEKLRGKLEGLANMTAGQSREFNNSFSGYVSGSDETARNDSLRRAQSTAGAMIGSTEGTNALRSNLISAGIRANQTDASGSLTREALATRSGLVDIARDLQANHSTALAQASPEMRAMISDISANDFSHLGSTYEVATSGSGSGVPVYASTYADDGNGNMINTYYDNQTQLYGSGNGLINENTDFSNLSVEETGRLARLAQTAWDYDAGADTYSFDGVNVKAFNEQQYDRLANAISHQLKTDAKFKDPANRQQVEDLNKFLTAGDHKRINPNAERTLRDLPKLPDGYTEKSDGKFEFNLNGRTQETDVERKKLERYLEDRVDAELYNARVQQTINDETDNNPRHHH